MRMIEGAAGVDMFAPGAASAIAAELDASEIIETHVLPPRLALIYEQFQAPDDGDYGPCFGCMYMRGVHVAPIAYDGWLAMNNYRKQSDSGADKGQQTKELKWIYDEKIRKPGNATLLSGQMPFPEWHEMVLYKHFFTAEHGRLDAASSHCNRLLMAEDMISSLYENELFKETLNRRTGERRRILDRETVDTILKLNTQIRLMWNTDPTKGRIGTINATPNLQQESPIFGGNRVVQTPRSVVGKLAIRGAGSLPRA
jgi:hypothetical protein